MDYLKERGSVTTHPIAEPLLDAEARLEGFDNLMPFKIQNILLILSLDPWV